MPGYTAVVIGINYSGNPTRVPPLTWAEADATAIADRLEAAGYTVTRMVGAAADERAIRRALTQAARAAGPDGLCLIYFSGHGLLDPAAPGHAYLAPVDIDPDWPTASGVPLADLAMSYLAAAASALVILDCCYSGAATGAPL